MSLPEYDIDLFLQERGAADPLAAEMIVQAYAPRLLRLVRAVFRQESAVQACLEQIIEQVMADLPGYAPGGEFRTWIYAHAARVILASHRRAAGRGASPPRASTNPQAIQRCLSGTDFDQGEATLAALERLLAEAEPTANLLLALHFAEDLDLETCAQILGAGLNSLHEYLNQFRYNIASILFPEGEHEDRARQPVHAGVRRKVNAGLDGLLESGEVYALQNHLLECDACREYERARRASHAFMRDLGARHWPLEGMSPEGLRELTASAGQTGARYQQLARTQRLVREWLWLAVPVLVAVFFIFNYRQFFPEPVVSRLPAPPVVTRLVRPTPTPTPFPEQPAPQIVQASAQIRNGSRPGSLPANLGPKISSDGDWVVFATTDRGLAPGDADAQSNVFLYARRQGATMQVDVAPQGEPADGHSFSPAISADGRYVAFASLATNLVPSGDGACDEEQARILCARIYLYDRQSSELVLVSLPGETGLYPQISGDGRWIVYWTPTDDARQEEYCRLQIGFDPQSGLGCWDLAFYDRLQAARSRLEIGRPAQAWTPYVFSLDISGDGSRVVFELNGLDSLVANSGERFGQFAGTHVVLYDRPSGVIQPVDANLADEIPSGSSYAGKISDDGRYVAFASEANDLVPSDDNRWPDIFVRDLASVRTERVSVTSQGGELFHEPYVGLINWYTHIDISPDGAQVLFLSNAPELGAADPAWCDTLSRGRVLCYHFYLHDRMTGATRLYLPAPAVGEKAAFDEHAILRSPSLSAGAAWLAFGQDVNACIAGECLDQYVYSEQDGERIELTRVDVGSRGDNWTFTGSAATSGGWITALAYDPSNPLLATGSQDGSLRIWSERDSSAVPSWQETPAVAFLTTNASPWQEMFRLDIHSQTITDLAFSPGGDLLAASSRDGTVSVWLSRSGSMRQRLRGHRAPVEALAFSPDGASLAAATRQGIWLWVQDEAGNFVHLDTLPPYDLVISSLDFSPDGRFLALGENDGGDVWLQPLAGGAQAYLLSGHEEAVTDVAFSPGGERLATASKDGSVNVWRIRGQGAGLLAQHENTFWHADWVDAIAFSPDGRTLAAGTFSASLHIWDLLFGDLVQTIQRTRQDQVMSVAFSPDGDQLVYAGAQGALHIFSRELGRPVARDTLFFRRYDSDTLTESPFNAPGIPWYYDSYQLAQPVTTLAQAQAEVPFPLLEPGDTDMNLTLNAVILLSDPKTQSPLVVANYIHTSNYQPSYLILTQSQVNPREFASTLGTSATITEMQVGEEAGEYAQGEWLFDSGSTTGAIVRNALRYQWDNAASSYRLRWSAGGIYYSLEYYQAYNVGIVYEDDRLQLEDLLAFAEALRAVEHP